MPFIHAHDLSTEKKNMISIKNLSYSYDKNTDQTVKNLSFNIQKGEFVSILGKSGCGKTSLANIICGYLKPTEGKIEIDGKISLYPDKNKIIVNQENDLFDWMTVYQNMEISTQDRDKILKYLHLVNLEDRINGYPSSLSGGMKKKLSFVRALSAQPDLLILDEPFSYLDYSTKAELLKQFQRIIKSTNTTTILITHNIDESLYLSDRIIVLKGHPFKISKDIKLNNKKIGKQEMASLVDNIKKSY